jgi:hypothetical protein
LTPLGGCDRGRGENDLKLDIVIGYKLRNLKMGFLKVIEAIFEWSTLL